MKKYFLLTLGLMGVSSAKKARHQRLESNTKELIRLLEASQKRKTKSISKTIPSISEKKQNHKDYDSFLKWWNMVQMYNPTNEIIKQKFNAI